MLNSLRNAAIAITATAALVFALPRHARADATSRPTISAGSGMRPGPAYVIQRFKKAIAQIDLTDDEKPKVNAVFDQANQRGLDLSQTLADMQPQDRYPKLAAFSKEIRQDLAGVLTDDQMKTLDQKLGSDGGQRPAAPQNAGGMLETVQQALAKLDLSDDQKQQVKDLISSAREKFADIRKSAAAGADVQQELQQARKDLRDKLQTILTPDQMQTFMASMQQSFQRRAHSSSGSADSPAENKPADLQFTGPAVGSPVPATPILEANGRLFSPSQYKGHVLVLEFGSMSCPVFRSHAQDMEKLKFIEGPRAFFLIVYTREAFPAGDKNVERNTQEGVSIPQTTTVDDRKAQALEAQRELRITIPMAVDPMDDAVSKTYGGFPNGAVVIGKDGAIAARQEWTNPDTLRQMIDDAFNAQESPGH